MVTIIEFLKARVAEDEAVARDATRGQWEVVPRGDQPKVQVVGSDAWLAITSSDPGVPRDANAQYIARNNPTRVLAECKAKRAIVEMHNSDGMVIVKKDGREFDRMTFNEYCKRFDLAPNPPDKELLALAAVYADHPDYLPEWAL